MSNTFTFIDAKPSSAYTYDFSIENVADTEAITAIEIKDLYDPNSLSKEASVLIRGKDQNNMFIENISLFELQSRGFIPLEAVPPHSIHQYTMVVRLHDQLQDNLQETSLTFNLRIGTEQKQETTTITINSVSSPATSPDPTPQSKKQTLSPTTPTPSPAILGITETVQTPTPSPLSYTEQSIERPPYPPYFFQAVTMSICTLLILLAVAIHLVSKKL